MTIVSVIIPTFNRYEQVQESIKSVQQQTLNTEIIVVNDCSEDKRYFDLDSVYPTVKFIHLPINLRVKYNVKTSQGLVRNEGVKVAKGQWLAFLDDDDRYIQPNKLEKQINLMQKYGCYLSSSNMLIHQNSSYFPNPPPIGTQLEEDIYRIQRTDLLKSNYINNSTTIVHSSIFEKIGGFRMIDNEDYDLWLRTLEHTDCVYLSDLTVYYELGSVKYYG